MNNLKYAVSENIKNKSTYVDKEIMCKIAEIDSFFFDDPKNNDVLLTINQSKDLISGSITSLSDILIKTVAFKSGLTMLASYNPGFRSCNRIY